MQTLKIDYESAFEALPGLYVLLQNDSPRFSVAAMSAEYCEKVCTSKNDARGRSIFEMQLECELRWDDFLLESLETVARTGMPHEFDHAIRHKGSHLVYHISNRPVRSENNDVSFIIHQLTLIADWPFAAAKKTVALEARDASLASIIDQAPVVVGILRGENLVLENANEKLLELFGKSRDIIGLPLLEAVPDIALQPFPDLMLSVLRTGKEYEGREAKAYVRKDGGFVERYFNFTYSPLKDLQNEVTGIVLIASDVTGLVMAKKEQEASERRYRHLIERATVPTAVFTGNEMIVSFANEAMLHVLGKDSTVIGKPIQEAVPELIGQPYIDLLQNVYRTGETYHSNEARATLKVNGKLQTFYFDFTYAALYDNEGKIYGILNTAVDVSQIVKGAIEIHEAEERWRLALNSAELGTWDYYPETKQFICSARTKELFGLPENSETKFETMLQAIHPRDRERVAQEIRKALRIEGGAHYHAEYFVVGISDQQKRWHRTTGQAFYNEDGNAYRLTGTLLDITDRKKIEEALEDRVNARTAELIETNKELERSNHELEQYAYVASHDLQEPLRKILVYSDLLKHNIPSVSTTPEDRLDKIISSARRMSQLIRDLLNFSKLLKTDDFFRPLNLGAIILNVLEDFELTIQETNALITIDDLPVVEASSQQMNQLFYNLISNALKFRKENVPPNVHIGARLLSKEEVGKTKELNGSLVYYDVFVRDQGIGFQPRYGKQIFEIFKRLNTPSKFEGTGIGLAVCRKIAARHQGIVYSESKEGKGAVFHVVLPLSQHPQSE